MGPKSVTLKFRAVNRDIFEAVRSGRKKIETRAATKKYAGIEAGDTVVLSCGRDRFEKRVTRAERFASVSAILRKYRPAAINPATRTAREARAMWSSFPGYKEKIRKCGLIAFHLE